MKLLTSFAAAMLVAGSAHAATIGNAVVEPGGADVAEAETIGGAAAGERTTLVNLANSDLLGLGATTDQVIGYFIPLTGGACTFGVAGCGLESDTGGGSGPMSMYLDFVNVDGGHAFLNLWFEDLDLIGANDPEGFFESVEIFDEIGNSLAFFDDITDLNVSGSADTQQVASLALGLLNAGETYSARLDFISDEEGTATNTPEFLLAAIDSVPVNYIPLPAAGWLMLAGLGGIAAMRRKKS